MNSKPCAIIALSNGKTRLNDVASTKPGYCTKQQSVDVHGVEHLKLRSLLNHDQFDDPNGVAEAMGISSALWPLFGLLWPSASHLAARMALRPLASTGRILEIGCGLALASLVGHRLGFDVTASDCHPLAETFLLDNLRLNGLEPMKYRHGDWSGKAYDASALAKPIIGRFDLVIGSDVLYERDPDGGLAHFISRHACHVAEVWIVDPNRGNRASFNRHMAEMGFSRRETSILTLASDSKAAYRGRMLTYRREVGG